MKFIKRYLTFHLCAILGYCLLIAGLYYSDPFANFKLFLWISFTPNIVSFMIYLMVALVFWTFFPKVLAIEVVIHLLVKKNIKKRLIYTLNYIINPSKNSKSSPIEYCSLIIMNFLSKRFSTFANDSPSKNKSV